MAEVRRAAMSWSSGKDSTMALIEAMNDPMLDVVCLLTTVSEAYDRVAIHGTRRALLEAQAKAIGLPLIVVMLPTPCTNTVYEARMARATEKLVADGIEVMIFGDLFLDDIRAYRETNLDGTGLTPVFPLWRMPTGPLARRMIDTGIVAHITTLDPKKLDAGLVGRRFDESLLADLPDEVDPCGENGEFHTVAVDAPIFSSPIPVTVGEIVEREGFVYADIVPESDQPSSG